MTPLVKTVSVVALFGVVAGAGGLYFGTDLFKSKSQEKKVSIASLMKTVNPEKRLITSKLVGDDDGKRSYKAYREANKDSEKDIGNLSNGIKPSDPIGNDDATSEFVSKCESNGQIEVSGKDDPLYKQVLSYCTRDTLVRDLIKEENKDKELLNESAQGSDKDSGGEAAWGVYRTQNSSKGKGQDPWGMEDGETKKDKEVLPTNYKSKCVEYSKKPAYQLNNDDYRNVLAGCTR